MKIFSFLPIADAKSKILILGTMPGKDSLKHHQYYAHSRNAFWKIMFALFDLTFSNDYDVKKALLLNNRIALWDVLKTCRRESSLDSDILEEQPNDLTGFLKKYPNINQVVFNGKSARLFFMKHIKEIAVPYVILPSTSPAHAIAIDKKIKEWTIITTYIDQLEGK